MPASDDWKAAPGANWQWKQSEKTPRSAWNWEDPTDQEPSAWNDGGQQELQADKEPSRPPIRHAEPAGQNDQKTGKQQEAPGDPRNPGGA
eukprot:9932743-Heterocapsa_arctica.AAC.1